tara:strand:+ start:313 stop:501 length:189 start_codon:yes stop_codon:yes gene_type:complete
MQCFVLLWKLIIAEKSNSMFSIMFYFCLERFPVLQKKAIFVCLEIASIAEENKCNILCLFGE